MEIFMTLLMYTGIGLGIFAFLYFIYLMILGSMWR